MRYIFLLLFPLFVHSDILEMQNLQEREFSQERLLYMIKAEKKTIDFKKLRHISFLRLQKQVSEAIFYENGVLHLKEIDIKFKRAYFFEGNLYMSGCYATFDGGTIEAKNALYKKESIEFKDLRMQKGKRIFHKYKYNYKLLKI